MRRRRPGRRSGRGQRHRRRRRWRRGGTRRVWLRVDRRRSIRAVDAGDLSSQTEMSMRTAFVALALSACASSNHFTRPEELDKIARSPIVKPPREQKIAHVESWKLTGLLPERIEHTPLA